MNINNNCAISVLIETLWNVKQRHHLRIIHSQIRINRNIVECKGMSKDAQTFVDAVLIETLWNVKIERMKNLETGEERINRNIVECKDIQL